MMRTFLLALLIAGGLLAACSSDNGGTTNPDPDPDPANSFRVDGSGLDNILVTTDATGRSANEILGTSGTVQLRGIVNGVQYRLAFKIKDIAVDTFTVVASGNATATLEVGAYPGSDRYSATQGTIGITRWDGAGGSGDGHYQLTLSDVSGTHTITVTGTFSVSPIVADPVNAIRADGWIFPNIVMLSDPTTAGQSLAGDGVVTMTNDLDGTPGTLTLTLKDVEVGTFPVSQVAGNAASYVIQDGPMKAALFAQSGTVTIQTWDGPGRPAAGYFEIIVSEGLNAPKVSMLGSFQVETIGNVD